MRGTVNLREERFIVAHKLRDFIPCSVAPLSSACGEAEHHVWECKVEEAAYLMVARKQRAKQEPGFQYLILQGHILQ